MVSFSQTLSFFPNSFQDPQSNFYLLGLPFLVLQPESWCFFTLFLCSCNKACLCGQVEKRTERKVSGDLIPLGTRAPQITEKLSLQQMLGISLSVFWCLILGSRAPWIHIWGCQWGEGGRTYHLSSGTLISFLAHSPAVAYLAESANRCSVHSTHT